MKIGVVVATYNGEKYIEEQLKSIISQTVLPTSIIISDANSIDKTILICENFLRKQKNVDHIIYKHNKRLNVTDNFNFGLNVCDADYMFMCDQDDVWLKHKIEITLKSLIKHNACLGFTNARIVNSSLRPSHLSLWEQIGFKCTSENILFNNNSDMFLDILIKKNIVTGMCTCISKELFMIAKDIPNTTIHDAWLAMVASCTGKVIAINKKCVLYRQHDNNYIGTKVNYKRIFENIYNYELKIQNRIKTIQLLIDRYKIYMHEDTKYKLNNYINFLSNRIIYLNSGKINFKEHKKTYKKYYDENQYNNIFIKDWIYSHLLSKII